MTLGNLNNYKETLIYGVVLAVLLVLLRWLELRFLIITHAFEIYAAAIAVLFTGLGIWLALKLSKPKIQTQIIEKVIEVPQQPQFVFNKQAVSKFGLSCRELEVLQLMSEGLSNQEIADHLFLSLPTIKTHGSRLFEKLEVRRRTQAVELGKKLAIIR
ncbi:MAG: LuxR C-terminal-related transcriptional regulator [Bacteroidota bacterium]